MTDGVDDQKYGMTARFDDGPELVSPAETLVRRLRPTGYQQQPTSEMGTAAQVGLDSVAIDDTRSVGCERLCLAALSALKFKDILRGERFSRRDASIVMAFVIARMVHPASEREAFRWLPRNSAILELLDLERGRPLKLDKLYRMRDGLQRRQKEIADALFAQTRTVFAAAGAVIFMT